MPFGLPEETELPERLSSVLEVIFLIFNEGYSATSGDDLMRPGLRLEALRLGRLLAEPAPREAEVHALVALMEIQSSRSAARTGPSGEPVQLHEQNRGALGPAARPPRLHGDPARAGGRRAPGPYMLQAAIAVCHAQARTAEETDWTQIATLYGALARLLPTAVVQLNRAVALGMAHGPQAGLDLLDSLVADPVLRDYHLFPSVRGDLLLRPDRGPEARREFLRAAALAKNAAERAFLRRRAQEVPASGGPAGRAPGRTLGGAAEGFLGRAELDAATVRSYGQTLRRLRLDLGDGTPLSRLTSEEVTRVCSAAWGTAAARTWNRHRSAVRSFGARAGLDGLAAGLERRTESRPRARALGPAQLEALWSDTEAPLRERTWRLLHESAAGVNADLSLNVEDLDLEDRRARAGRTWLSRRSGKARLLPLLPAGRTRGPVFLSDRRPGPARTRAPDPPAQPGLMKDRPPRATTGPSPR